MCPAQCFFPTSGYQRQAIVGLKAKQARKSKKTNCNYLSSSYDSATVNDIKRNNLQINEKGYCDKSIDHSIDGHITINQQIDECTQNKCANKDNQENLTITNTTDNPYNENHYVLLSKGQTPKAQNSERPALFRHPKKTAPIQSQSPYSRPLSTITLISPIAPPLSHNPSYCHAPLKHMPYRHINLKRLGEGGKMVIRKEIGEVKSYGHKLVQKKWKQVYESQSKQSNEGRLKYNSQQVSPTNRVIGDGQTNGHGHGKPFRKYSYEDRQQQLLKPIRCRYQSIDQRCNGQLLEQIDYVQCQTEEQQREQGDRYSGQPYQQQGKINQQQSSQFSDSKQVVYAPFQPTIPPKTTRPSANPPHQSILEYDEYMTSLVTIDHENRCRSVSQNKKIKVGRLVQQTDQSHQSYQMGGDIAQSNLLNGANSSQKNSQNIKHKNTINRQTLTNFTNKNQSNGNKNRLSSSNNKIASNLANLHESIRYQKMILIRPSTTMISYHGDLKWRMLECLDTAGNQTALQQSPDDQHRYSNGPKSSRGRGDGGCRFRKTINGQKKQFSELREPKRSQDRVEGWGEDEERASHI